MAHKPDRQYSLKLTTPAMRLRRHLLECRVSLCGPPPPPTEKPAPLNRRSFLGRVTPAVMAKIPAHVEKVSAKSAKRKARHELARRELHAFNGRAENLLAAISLTCRPSTLKTKAATLGAIAPEHRTTTKEWIAHASLSMMTKLGKPKSAQEFNVQAFRAALSDHRADPLLLRAARVLWVTASRAADLKHFEPTRMASSFGPVWKIELHAVEHDGRLIGPKSDQKGKRHIVKWIPDRPGFEPTGLNKITWNQVDELTKTFGATPHSIRQTAVKFLQAHNFTSAEIVAVTGHAVSENTPGLRPYMANLPCDPLAILAIRQASILMRALQT